MLKQPNLGIKLREKRKQLGLTLKHVAERALITHPALIDIEMGRRNPKPETFKYLCQILSINSLDVTDLPVTRVLGIDPGSLSGALTIIDLIDKQLIVRKYSLKMLNNMIKDFDKTDYVFLEKVSSFPHDSHKASFSFGQNFGQIEGVLFANNVNAETVLPINWQKTMWSGVSRKDNPSKHAKNNYTVNTYFPKHEIPQRGEASVLIALYGLSEIMHRNYAASFDRLKEFDFNKILENLK